MGFLGVLFEKNEGFGCKNDSRLMHIMVYDAIIAKFIVKLVDSVESSLLSGNNAFLSIMETPFGYINVKGWHE